MELRLALSIVSSCLDRPKILPTRKHLSTLVDSLALKCAHTRQNVLKTTLTNRDGKPALIDLDAVPRSDLECQLSVSAFCKYDNGIQHPRS